MRIDAILSDYDGTLCPTGAVRNQDENHPGKCGGDSMEYFREDACLYCI